MEIAWLYIFSYLVGALPTAYIIGKLVKGVDIRQYGSGNVGGANVFYSVGKWWLVPLGLFEILVKGASPVWVGLYVLGLDRSSPWLIGAPLLAVTGHNWSIYLKFQGGRGVALAGGTLLALSPLLLGAFVAVAAAGLVLTRSSGVSVLVGLLLLPFWAIIAREPFMISWYCTGLATLVILKRLVSNWASFPEDVPRKKVLFNRLFLDRDVDDRSEWIRRVPGGTK